MENEKDKEKREKEKKKYKDRKRGGMKREQQDKLKKGASRR